MEGTRLVCPLGRTLPLGHHCTADCDQADNTESKTAERQALATWCRCQEVCRSPPGGSQDLPMPIAIARLRYREGVTLYALGTLWTARTG
eukprot:scaffold707_cov399-Prasinococcus_capsulatus_cf.AAC.15